MTTEYDHGDFVIHALVTSDPRERIFTDDLGLDVESTGEEGDANRLRLVQIATPDEAWTFDVSDSDQRAWAIGILENPNYTFWSHTNVDVWQVYQSLGIDISLRSKDTHTLAKLARPGKFADNGIKHLSSVYVDNRLAEWDERREQRFTELRPVRPKKPSPIRQRKGESDEAWAIREADYRARLADWETGVAAYENFNGWRDVPVDDDVYQQYAGMDAIYAIRLAPILTRVAHDSGVSMERINKEQTLYQIVTQLRLRGQRVDTQYVEDILLGENLVAFESATERFIALTGFKPGSRPYVPDWLAARGVQFTEFTKVKDKLTGQWKRGGPSLSAEPLDRLIGRYDSRARDDGSWRPEVSMALHLLREIGSVTNAVTVGKSFLSHTDSTGRVHSWVKALGAETGRMSATDPAIQTIKGKNRGAIIPYEDDHILVSVDLSQIEPRIAATDAGAVALIDKILEGYKVYDALAMILYPAGYTQKQYKLLKRIVLATLYGAGIDTIVSQARLIDHIEVTPDEVQTVRAEFYRMTPEIKQFGKRLERELDVRLPSTRLVPGDPDRLYKNLNSWVQGTARDFFVDVILRLHKMGLTKYIVNLIHDEVLFSLPKAEWRAIVMKIREAFEVPYRGTPIVCECEVYTGGRWGAGTKIFNFDTGELQDV